jgi:GH25 family lysozyme M1 (1,4-beta-N-acetylmuramidase)
MTVIVLGSAIASGPERAAAQRPLGIDVSSYQGSAQTPPTNINWTAVKSSGISFAWTKATEGTGYIDADFIYNEAHAKAAGVLIGAYHFAHPEIHLGTAGADVEAAYFWAEVKNYVVGGGAYLMPMLDYETSPGTTYTKTTSSQWVNEWCQQLVNYGRTNGVTVKPVVYTYVSFATSWLDTTVTQWPLWMAQYPASPNPQTGSPSSTSPWSTWMFWQFTSTSVIQGIVGNCDEDVFNGTTSTMATYVIGGPSITNSPASTTVAEGSNVTFSVGATGSGTLHYQWEFNGTNIAGATTTQYFLNDIQLTNAGGYSVLVSNTSGSTLSAPAFLSVLAPLTNVPGCVIGPSNMVNWWPAEGNAKDIFGTNNCTPYYGSSYGPGKQVLAFHFDGVTSFLTNGAPSIPVPWTACMWVNRQNAPGSGAALTGDGTYELKLEQYNGTRQVGFTQFGVNDYTFGYIAPVGVWTHLAFVGTGTGTSLYVNGTLQATLTNTLPLPRAYIGAGYVNNPGKFVDFMLGSLDELMTFNRALSSSEIHAIYAAGSAGIVRAPEFTGETPAPGQFTLNLKGQTGKNFTLYSSTNLIDWRPRGTIPNPTGTAQFIDALPAVSGQFYRASQ